MCGKRWIVKVSCSYFCCSSPVHTQKQFCSVKAVANQILQLSWLHKRRIYEQREIRANSAVWCGTQKGLSEGK